MKFRPMALLWGVLALVIAVCAITSVRPNVSGPVARFALVGPYAQLLALRGWLVVGLVLAAIFLLILGITRRILLGRGRIALTLALVFTLVAGAHAATLVSRGITAKSELGPDPGITEVSSGDGSITVLEYNTRGGEVPMEKLADLIESSGADVVTLPETSTAGGKELQAELSERGLGFQRFDTDTPATEADYDSTVMLVARTLGEYRQSAVEFSSEEGTLTGVGEVKGENKAGVSISQVAQMVGKDVKYSRTIAIWVAPAKGQGPEFIAVHPVAPKTLRTDGWKREIRAIYSLCETYPDAVIAGDFNSTTDHEQALRMPVGCRDAVAQAGAGGRGTWPTNVPSLLGAPIDRVLAPSQYKGSSAAIVDLGGSDHRGVLVRLTPVVRE